MSEAAQSRSDHELRMMEAMVDCAHALGMAFGNAARAEADNRRALALFEAFQKSFLAVRMGIRLSLTLRAGARTAPAATEHDRLERERAEGLDRVEREPAERLEQERERERDHEPVSLPRFLAALGVVARDAEGLDLPADVRSQTLPVLRDLLAHARTDASPSPARAAGGVAVLARPAAVASKAALLGSASAPLTAPLPRRGPGLPRPPPRGPG